MPVPSGRSRRCRPDAIIVPAARPASALAGLIELAAELETALVVLCSRQAKVDQVAERLRRVNRSRGLVVHVGNDYKLPVPEFETSLSEFIKVSYGRTSDLSLKRNFGLLLARRLGWRKTVFIDDDITVSAPDVARLAHQLDDHPFAGMVCHDFPDNSVVCHARTLAQLPQDQFVTGAVLGVNCSDHLPLPFFPDIYNEDWFAFGEAAARHRLTKTGEAHQASYEPFATSTRACYEEFGDLLAEGLYWLMQQLGPDYSFRQITHLASKEYWSTFIHVRLETLRESKTLLGGFMKRGSYSDEVPAAIRSLQSAEDRYTYNPITADACVDFLKAWQSDVEKWGKCSRVITTGTISDAMSWLHPTSWDWVR